MDEDNNKIDDAIKISYCLKIFKLLIMIFNFTYFIANSWLIYCEIIDRHYPNDDAPE